MYLDSDRRPPITPQLAFRVAVIGGLALIMFAIIFFRLWYLEVLSGDKYRQEANNNKVRLVREQAPRGAIVDRDNRTLVENRQATVIQLRPTSLPDAERAAANRWGQEVGLRLRRPKRASPAETAASHGKPFQISLAYGTFSRRQRCGQFPNDLRAGAGVPKIQTARPPRHCVPPPRSWAGAFARSKKPLSSRAAGSARVSHWR